MEVLEKDAHFYWAPTKANRGGDPPKIYVELDDHTFRHAIARSDTVADLLCELGRPDATIGWNHYFLIKDIPLIALDGRIARLCSSSSGLLPLRVCEQCVKSDHITLAELVLWRYLPGDHPDDWIAEDSEKLQTRSAGLELAWEARCFAMKAAGLCKARGGPPRTWCHGNRLVSSLASS